MMCFLGKKEVEQPPDWSRCLKMFDVFLFLHGLFVLGKHSRSTGGRNNIIMLGGLGQNVHIADFIKSSIK